MTPQQRYRYYSALQSKKASVFLFRTLENLSDTQLRLCARALNLSVEEDPVKDWRPPSITLKRQAPVASEQSWRPKPVALRR